MQAPRSCFARPGTLLFGVCTVLHASCQHAEPAARARPAHAAHAAPAGKGPAPALATATAATSVSTAPALQANPAVAGATENAERALKTLLQQLTAQEQGEWQQLQPLCQVGIQPQAQPEAQRRSLGCLCCPPFDECPAQAKPLLVTASENLFHLRHTHYGWFTGAERQLQRAAIFEGCESGAEGRGGTLLHNMANSAPELIRYFSGVNPDQCWVVGAPGQHDQLLCQTQQGMGSTYYTHLELIDLTQDSPQIEHLATFDQDYLCLKDEEPYVSVELGLLRLVDVNADGLLDIELPARTHAGTLTTAQLATCTSDSIRMPSNLAPAQSDVFTFVRRGRSFQANAATTRRLTQLQRAKRGAP